MFKVLILTLAWFNQRLSGAFTLPCTAALLLQQRPVSNTVLGMFINSPVHMCICAWVLYRHQRWGVFWSRINHCQELPCEKLHLLSTGGAALDSRSEKYVCGCFFMWTPVCVTERERERERLRGRNQNKRKKKIVGLPALLCVSVCQWVCTNVWASSVICQSSGYMCVCFELSDWRSMELHIRLSCAAEKCL